MSVAMTRRLDGQPRRPRGKGDTAGDVTVKFSWEEVPSTGLENHTHAAGKCLKCAWSRTELPRLCPLVMSVPFPGPDPSNSDRWPVHPRTPQVYPQRICGQPVRPC